MLPGATTRPDGTFTFSQVAPGDYRVFVRASAAPQAPSSTTVSINNSSPLLWGLADVSVTGSDVTGVALNLQPAMSFAGRVVFEGKTAHASRRIQGRVAQSAATFSRQPRSRDFERRGARQHRHARTGPARRVVRDQERGARHLSAVREHRWPGGQHAGSERLVAEIGDARRSRYPRRATDDGAWWERVWRRADLL